MGAGGGGGGGGGGGSGGFVGGWVQGGHPIQQAHPAMVGPGFAYGNANFPTSQQTPTAHATLQPAGRLRREAADAVSPTWFMQMAHNQQQTHLAYLAVEAQKNARR
jgi:hypothetical protein